LFSQRLFTKRHIATDYDKQLVATERNKRKNENKRNKSILKTQQSEENMKRNTISRTRGIFRLLKNTVNSNHFHKITILTAQYERPQKTSRGSRSYTDVEAAV